MVTDKNLKIHLTGNVRQTELVSSDHVLRKF